MAMKDYEKEYHSFFHKKLLGDKEYYFFRSKYADRIYWKFFRNRKHGKFLEFGCGLGQNIYLHRHNTEGVDISEFCIGKCKDKGIKVTKQIESLASESFDGILSCHVLEHVEEPTKILKHFLRLLKKGGRLVLVLPVSIQRNMKPLPEAGHIFAWTIPTMWALLERVGFRVRHAKYNCASGFSLFYKLPFKLALFNLKVLGYIRKQREMILVAEK